MATFQIKLKVKYAPVFRLALTVEHSVRLIFAFSLLQEVRIYEISSRIIIVNLLTMQFYLIQSELNATLCFLSSLLIAIWVKWEVLESAKQGY